MCACSSCYQMSEACLPRCCAPPDIVRPSDRAVGLDCAGVIRAGKPVSQDRAGWAWEPLATTTAWNYQIGARLTALAPVGPVRQQPGPTTKPGRHQDQCLKHAAAHAALSRLSVRYDF
jgi:hypothetical protein